MKSVYKKFAAGLLIFSMATTSFVFNPPRAEAFDLGDLAKIFGVGGNDLETSKNRMLKNFNYSTALLTAAYENVKLATDDSIANKEIITKERATRAALKTSDAGLHMKNGAGQNRRDAENMKKYLSNALAAGDEEKLKQIDSFIKVANEQRTLSDFMAGIAYTQIGLITVSKLTNLFSGNFKEFETIMAIAQETDQLLKVRGELSDLLNTATAEYRMARGIKDPSKEEQQKTADQIEKG